MKVLNEQFEDELTDLPPKCHKSFLAAVEMYYFFIRPQFVNSPKCFIMKLNSSAHLETLQWRPEQFCLFVGSATNVMLGVLDCVDLIMSHVCLSVFEMS